MQSKNPSAAFLFLPAACAGAPCFDFRNVGPSVDPPHRLNSSFAILTAEVGAPAFMRGKERFSAPGKVWLLTTRFSAGDRRSRG